ncbi:MAG: FkbM family methyltransferase, partial [Gemmatimonadaceae bacterium]
MDQLVPSSAMRLPSIIKMDVEGGELPAIRGMRQTLSTARPRMLIEYHGARTESDDDDDSLS